MVSISILFLTLTVYWWFIEREAMWINFLAWYQGWRQREDDAILLWARNMVIHSSRSMQRRAVIMATSPASKMLVTWSQARCQENLRRRGALRLSCCWAQRYWPKDLICSSFLNREAIGRDQDCGWDMRSGSWRLPLEIAISGCSKPGWRISSGQANGIRRQEVHGEIGTMHTIKEIFLEF